MQCINVFYRFGARVHLAGTHRLTLANQTIRCSASLSNINLTANLYCNRYSSHSQLTGGACNYQIVNFPHDKLVFGRCSNLQLQPVRFAGHSHWKNIKSTKEAKDSLKQRTYLDVCRRIKIAVQGKFLGFNRSYQSQSNSSLHPAVHFFHSFKFNFFT